MTFRSQFGAALRAARRLKGMPQEALDVVSSRTYVSVLERGAKSPTLDKLNDIAGAIGVHPLALLLYAYSSPLDREKSAKRLLRDVEREFEALMQEVDVK